MTSFNTKDTYAKGWDYARFVGMIPEAIANMTAVMALDATIDELAYVATWTGAGTGSFGFAYQIGGNFQKFMKHSDDFSFTACQTGDSGDGADITLAVEVYDDTGKNISDGTMTATAAGLTFTAVDAAISDPDRDGAVGGGDYIYVVVTVSGTLENNDVLTMSIPKIKYKALY